MKIFNFISSVPNLIPFLFFPCRFTLQRTCSIMLNKNSDMMVNIFALPIFKRVLKTSETDLIIEIRTVIASQIRVSQLTGQYHKETICQNRGELYFVLGHDHMAVQICQSSLNYILEIYIFYCYFPIFFLISKTFVI